MTPPRLRYKITQVGKDYLVLHLRDYENPGARETEPQGFIPYFSNKVSWGEIEPIGLAPTELEKVVVHFDNDPGWYYFTVITDDEFDNSLSTLTATDNQKRQLADLYRSITIGKPITIKNGDCISSPLGDEMGQYCIDLRSHAKYIEAQIGWRKSGVK